MMAAFKPWYKIDGLTFREDLREGKPLDASFVERRAQKPDTEPYSILRRFWFLVGILRV